MAHHARSLPPFHAWYPRLRERPLDLRLRYLAYVRTSQLNRCRYCVTHNGAAGRKAGIPKEQLEALADHRTSPLFSELERLVIAYAEALTTAVHADGALVETPPQRLVPTGPGHPTPTAPAA